MNILSWIILGLIAGAIANVIFPDSSKGGIVGALILGIAGAFIGGLIASMFLGQGVTGFNLTSLLVAIGGSILLLFLGRYINRT